MSSSDVIFEALFVYFRFRPAPEDKLLKAFQVIDPVGRGYLTQEELTKYMTTKGMPFLKGEIEEMLSAALDPDKNLMLYKDFVPLKCVEET